MDRRAERLAEWAQDRVGDGLRAVGYHTSDGHGVTYVRDDLQGTYPRPRVAALVETVRDLDENVQSFEADVGSPRESLYVLDDALITQFHFGGDGAVFMSFDFDVGRGFVSFVEECRSRMV